MKNAQLLSRIYLGDRACKSIRLDGWNDRVIVQVDCISRLRPEATQWDFFTDEDIEDGLLVFSGVRSVSLSPSGLLPNDLINKVEVQDFPCPSGSLSFRLSIGHVRDDGSRTEVLIEICAETVHMEDPLEPGVPVAT